MTAKYTRNVLKTEKKNMLKKIKKFLKKVDFAIDHFPDKLYIIYTFERKPSDKRKAQVKMNGLLAQVVEHRPFKAAVDGSSPS